MASWGMTPILAGFLLLCWNGWEFGHSPQRD